MKCLLTALEVDTHHIDVNIFMPLAYIRMIGALNLIETGGLLKSIKITMVMYQSECTFQQSVVTLLGARLDNNPGCCERIVALGFLRST